MKSTANPSLPDPPPVRNLQEVMLYLRELKRETERALQYLYDDIAIGQSRFQTIRSTATSTMLKSTLSQTDIGVFTISHSAGGSRLLVTVSGVALSATLT